MRLPALLSRAALPLAAAALVAPLLTTPTAAAAAPTGSTAAGTAGAAGVGSIGVGSIGVRAAGVRAAAARRRVAPRGIVHKRWDGQRQLETGRHRGTTATDGALVLGTADRRRWRSGTAYDAGFWLSTWRRPGFGLTELIASWQARTPGDSWIQVDVRVRDAAGKYSSWDTLAQWANTDRHVERTSIAGQADDMGSVATDTWRAARSEGVRQWQVRVWLMRRAGTSVVPSVDAVGAVASRLPSGDSPTSAPGPGRGVALDLPEWSQYTHTDHYPQWGGGGEAWCSPTSVSMVLGYWDRLPKPREYRFVPAGHPQPWIDHAARYSYDHGYRGTGNWAFATAYAALRGTDAFVTRLRSLREAEDFLVAGIPLVASIAFGRGELSGAPISSSGGHLLVVSGFDESGDVVVHDPAGRGSGVERTYDRAEFERLWLRASGGLVYVIRGEGTALPARGNRRNW